MVADLSKRLDGAPACSLSSVIEDELRLDKNGVTTTSALNSVEVQRKRRTVAGGTASIQEAFSSLQEQLGGARVLNNFCLEMTAPGFVAHLQFSNNDRHLQLDCVSELSVEPPFWSRQVVRRRQFFLLQLLNFQVLAPAFLVVAALVFAGVNELETSAYYRSLEAYLAAWRRYESLSQSQDPDLAAQASDVIGSLTFVPGLVLIVLLILNAARRAYRRRALCSLILEAPEWTTPFSRVWQRMADRRTWEAVMGGAARQIASLFPSFEEYAVVAGLVVLALITIPALVMFAVWGAGAASVYLSWTAVVVAVVAWRRVPKD